VGSSLFLLFSFSNQPQVVIVNAIFFGVYPACVYLSARKSSFPPLAAGLAACMSVIVAADTSQKHLFGLQSWSFTWEGWGLYTQIVAAVWAFLAWGEAFGWIVHGSGFLRASVFLAFSWLSHLIVGYGMSAVTVVLILGVYSPRLKHPFKTLGWAFVRWLVLNLTVAFLISYLILPTLVEAHILNRSRFEPAEYWDSYGAKKAFDWLFKGRLLDRIYRDSAWAPFIGNFPVYTTLVLSGVVVIGLLALRHLVFSRQQNNAEELRSKSLLLVLGAFVAAFILFTGRSTFGPTLLKLVPFSVNLPFHRFFVHFHMFAILICGWMIYQIGRLVCWVIGRFSSVRGLGYLICVILFCLLFVYPIGSHLYARTRQHRIDLRAQEKDTEEWWGNATYTLMKVVSDRVHENPGRAYAGAGWNWGKQFTLKFAKVYSLWTQRGLLVPNISYMWHAMGLNSEMDNHLVEQRLDHLKLYNLRYVLCKPGTVTQPANQISEVHGGHAIFEWTSATGYFDFIQLIGCVSAHSMPKDSFWLWREQYVMARHTHALGKHYRTALLARERCRGDEERIDAALPKGEILAQEGNVDDFQATIKCDEPRGCSVMVRITYHPLFEVRAKSTAEVIPTFAISPSYIGMVVPQGTDTYNVRWRTPIWSKLLFWICYLSMFGFLGLSMFNIKSILSPPPVFLAPKKSEKNLKKE
jgi:hypothetical protein